MRRPPPWTFFSASSETCPAALSTFVVTLREQRFVRLLRERIHTRWRAPPPRNCQLYFIYGLAGDYTDRLCLRLEHLTSRPEPESPILQ